MALRASATVEAGTPILAPMARILSPGCRSLRACALGKLGRSRRCCGLQLSKKPGTELGNFSHRHHFASWLGLTARRDVSGGKVIRHTREKSRNRIAGVLRMAANAGICRAHVPVNRCSARTPELIFSVEDNWRIYFSAQSGKLRFQHGDGSGLLGRDAWRDSIGWYWLRTLRSSRSIRH